MRNGKEVQRVLLIPFAPGIGDAVMMEPLIRAVRRGFPDARLSVAAREHATDILQPAGFDFVFPSVFVERTPGPLRPFHRYIPQRMVAWFAEPALVLDLGPFDKVINLFLAWESGLPFDRWWMPQWPLQVGARHTIDVLASYLEEDLEISIPAAEREPRIDLFPEAEEWAEHYARSEGARGRPVVSMVVTAANSLKWWFAPKWGELNDRLNRMGWRTQLIAPKGNRHALDVYDLCRAKPLWPDVNLRQLSALLASSDVVVGIDTGPLHIAAALGTPWVGLYGPTNPQVIGPYTSSRGAAIVAGFSKPDSCKDCWLAFKNREDVCRTLPSTGCTTLIPVDEVAQAVEEVARGVKAA